MASQYKGLNSDLTAQGSASQSWEADPPRIQLQPSAPLYYELNQDPDVPPPTYNSLFDSAVSFPKTIKKNLINNIRGNNTAPANDNIDENEVEGAVNDAGVDTNQNNDDNDDEPDTCCGTLCLCVLVNIVFCGIPIAQLIMGFLYKDDCPIDDRIPLFLLVNGTIFTLLWQQIWIPTIKGCSETLIVIINVVAVLFLFAWFICGSVWVFKAKSTVVLSESNAIELPIKGPFRYTTFSIVTSAPLTKDTMDIQWEDDSYYRNPSKAELRLKISYHSIHLCNSSTPLRIHDGHVFKGQDVWSFYISSSELSIWLNDKLAFVGRKYGDNEDCQIWKNDLDIIETLTGPVRAIRTYDTDSNLYGGLSAHLYCSKKLYSFAFWLLVVTYIIGGLLLLGLVLL